MSKDEFFPGSIASLAVASLASIVDGSSVGNSGATATSIQGTPTGAIQKAPDCSLLIFASKQTGDSYTLAVSWAGSTGFGRESWMFDAGTNIFPPNGAAGTPIYKYITSQYFEYGIELTWTPQAKSSPVAGLLGSGGAYFVKYADWSHTGVLGQVEENSDSYTSAEFGYACYAYKVDNLYG